MNIAVGIDPGATRVDWVIIQRNGKTLVIDEAARKRGLDGKGLAIMNALEELVLVIDFQPESRT